MKAQYKKAYEKFKYEVDTIMLPMSDYVEALNEIIEDLQDVVDNTPVDEQD